jgi:hypothetical protein
MFYVWVIAVAVLVLVVTAIRLRRGGPGPAVNYVPRVRRPRVNAYYRSRDWQEPFDVDGNRNPMRDKI